MNDPDQTDAELSARFEREALSQLDQLYRAALGLTGDGSAAEELLKETIINAYRQCGSLPESTDLTTLLYRGLTNRYISSSPTRQHSLARCPTDTARSSTRLSLAEVEALEALPTAQIIKSLQVLEPHTRIAVYYADVEGFSYRKIGEITNRSVSAVMSLLRHGREQVRNALLAAAREPAAGQSRKDAAKKTTQVQTAPRHRLTESDACADQLDWFDLEIVRYVLLWAPHGQMWEEDVYPLFGMTVGQLIDRFHRIIATSVPHLSRLAKSDRELLDKVRNLSSIFGHAG